MNRIKVVIIFGSCSEEHDVSVKSTIEIATNIDMERFGLRYIGITESGVWKLCKKPYTEWEADSLPAILSPDRKTHGLLVMKKSEYEIRCIDMTFPVLHGKCGDGEDDVVQGLFVLSGIPYVGCDIQGSAAYMDKSLTYTLTKNTSIAVPEFQMIGKDDKPKAGTLTYPVFVRPARSDSSFDVTKVNGTEELNAAIEAAGQYDGKISIKQAISGYEVGCAVVRNRDDLTVGEIDQVRLSHDVFHIHQEDRPEKGSEDAVITVPADIPVEERNRVQETAKRVYRMLGYRGPARVDLFLQEDGDIALNEVNTLPGFISYSHYPRMMAATGIMLPALIDSLITLVLKR